MYGIKDKIAIITGASGSLAGSIAKSFAQAGAQLVLLTRKESSLNELIDEINELGGKAKAYEADILDEESLIKVKNQTTIQEANNLQR